MSPVFALLLPPLKPVTMTTIGAPSMRDGPSYTTADVTEFDIVSPSFRAFRLGRNNRLHAKGRSSRYYSKDTEGTEKHKEG
jgi:hypothetical protein